MNEWPSDIPPLPLATPEARPVALLLRHGERPPIAPGEFGADLTLTEAGRQRAKALGRALGTRLGKLHTSPIRRCRETAEALRLGARSSAPLVNDRLLGDPGVFVADPELAWENWRTRGHEGMLLHLAGGTEPLPGLAEPSAAARRLVAHIQAHLDRVLPRIHVFVTHDAILYPAVARLFEIDADRSWIPDFLECASIWREGTSIHLAYRHLTRDRSKRSSKP